MPDSEDYRKYLDTRFEGLTKIMSAQFINVHDKLDSIERQTFKTNGRVTELEAKESTHVINCPIATDVKKINEDLEEYRMIKRYPKIVIMIISIFVLTTIYGFYKMIDNQDKFKTSQDNLKTQVDMINTPVEDKRTGKIFLYPSGMMIDSVINKK